MLPIDDIRRSEKPISFEKAKDLDYIWMIDFAFNPKPTPLLVGWNSLKFTTNHASNQKIFYLPQIKSFSYISCYGHRNHDDIQVADECNKDSIAVTYDLDIAKVALQPKFKERPKFDRLFVALGSFHIEFAVLGVCGKYIDCSGVPHILNVEKGSMNSFLTGKNYKRSKRAHQLLALAFEILHFKFFLHSQDHHFHEALNEISGGFNYESMPSHVGELLERYDEFAKKTKRGTPSNCSVLDGIC